jgi:hypothetical protein
VSSLPKKSRGGPKTARGKQVSSQNSLVHGATSNNVVNADQKALIERYEYELMAFYKPESPLEKLQIQRIALCRAKLDALYDLEQVKLRIASEDLKRSPELVMQKIGVGKELTQTFVKTLVNGLELDLPLGLKPALLQLISSEINDIGGKLDADVDLEIALPNLGKLTNEIAVRINSSPKKVLIRAGEKINEMKTETGALKYSLRQMLRPYVEVNRDEFNEEPLSNNVDTKSEEEANLKKINEALDSIVALNSVVISALEKAKEFTLMQELLLRSVTLGGEESDRLMRYQTTWERRLSSAIGELLALQSKNARQ